MLWAKVTELYRPTPDRFSTKHLACFPNNKRTVQDVSLNVSALTIYMVETQDSIYVEGEEVL